MCSKVNGCVLLAQYREATSDLTEALEFFRTVHADELFGYEGDSVRHIVDTLRASRPHLYPSMSAVFSYNAMPPHNRSLSVPVAADVWPPWNESDRPSTTTDGSVATVERRRRVGYPVNRIIRRSRAKVSDGSKAWAAAGRGSRDRRRRQAVEADETGDRKQLSSSWASKTWPARDNEISVSDYADFVDGTIVVVRNNDHGEMTPRRDGKLAEGEVEDTEDDVTAVSDDNGGVSVSANDSWDVVNATQNVTKFPPPPDQKYVDTLFKIAHIFHFVGIGILAFFVLQVAVSTCVRKKQTQIYIIVEPNFVYI